MSNPAKLIDKAIQRLPDGLVQGRHEMPSPSRRDSLQLDEHKVKFDSFDIARSQKLRVSAPDYRGGEYRADF